jgi:hypothetical protein
LITIIAILLSREVSADISGKRIGEHIVQVWITGTITKDDAAAFTRLARVLTTQSLMVELDSIGGDVDAAMAIGRLIRNAEGHTRIPDQAKCYSSCALIFISGVVRSNYGELGLHRPYLVGNPARTSVIEAQTTRMLSSLKSYLAEMGVTDSFYELMVNTEPANIVILRPKDTTRVVSKYDPIFEAVAIARQAKEHGTTIEEMRRRRAEADKCSRANVDAFLTCQGAILWGLSEQVYRERLPKTRQCALTDEEKRLVAGQAQTRTQTSEHPLVLRMQSCVRRIILGQ